MRLTRNQQQAIADLVSIAVGADEFNRLFQGSVFSELDDTILYIFARDEDFAAEMEDKYALLIARAASDVLGIRVEFVIVLPGELNRDSPTVGF